VPRTTEDTLTAFVTDLEAKGVPLFRASTSVQALHPEVYVRNVVWTRGAGCQVIVRDHDIVTKPAYTESPIVRIHAGDPFVRCNLRVAEESIPYPVCRQLRAEGCTDYVAYPLPMASRVSFVSFATQEPSGFSPAQIDTLEASLGKLSRDLEVEYLQYALESLISVYLGPNAASRVLAGAFKRGTGESLQAAIWTCDLRGFTNLADSRPPTEVVRILDRYFDAVGEPIESNGGEILKFIGDAVLAVFPAANDPQAACARALAAAEQAIVQLKAVSDASVAAQGPVLELGVALHFGDVFYGNIGAQRRLDFTVIGAAVNEVSRVEPLCKVLHTPLLVTDVFRALVPDAPLVSKGSHALRGASQPRELFTLRKFQNS
jgi:adenylate cyclase